MSAFMRRYGSETLMSWTLLRILSGLHGEDGDDISRLALDLYDAVNTEDKEIHPVSSNTSQECGLPVNPCNFFGGVFLGDW